MNPHTYADSFSDLTMHREGRSWLYRQFESQPPHIANALAARHKHTTAQALAAGQPNPTRPANAELRDYVASTRWMLRPDANEEQLRAWAKHRAQECRQSMARVDGDEMDTYAAGRNIVTRFGLKAPEPKGDITLQGCIARMADAQWWRRQARTIHGRKMEREARALGLVHECAGLYISHDGFKRWRARSATNARTLADSVAVCDTGEEMNLADIAATGISNPSIRRAELMGRIAGLERIADKQGHAALFVTMTAPSEQHAIKSGSLARLAGVNVTPRECHGWIRKQWGKARSSFKRAGVTWYGMRVAEPHHDGTPHWHLLLFMPADEVATVRDILKRYAVDGSTDSKRIKHACKFEIIDRAKGSATGYIAKYIAKAIDGHGLEAVRSLDDYGESVWLSIDPKQAADRVRAWASQWGIRQFQFIGAPPVTVWRELRRLGEIRDNPAAEQLRQAADTGDFAAYVELMGGPCVPAKSRPARVRYQADSELGRYGEPKRRLFVEAYGSNYESRPRKWVIEYRPGVSPASRSGVAASTWTRGNNCTQFGNASPIARPQPPPLHAISGYRASINPADTRSSSSFTQEFATFS